MTAGWAPALQRESGHCNSNVDEAESRGPQPRIYPMVSAATAAGVYVLGSGLGGVVGVQHVEENLSKAGGAAEPPPGGGFLRNRAQIQTPTGTRIVPQSQESFSN